MEKFVDYSRLRKILYSMPLGILIGIGLAAIFFAGFFVHDYVQQNDLLQSSLVVEYADPEYRILQEVDTLLQQHYLRELPDTHEREYAAIRGMLTILGDRNTFFIDPPVTQSESDVLAGTYGGIGVSIRRDLDGQVVLTPFTDSPAEKVGLVEGDILLAVNDRVIDSTISQDAIDQMLRGEVKDNNGVNLKIMSGDNIRTVFILFDVINVPSVLWRVVEPDNVGYVQIFRFTNRTPDEVTSAIHELQQRKVEGIILDLRNNSGGLLQESVAVAGRFLGNKVIYIQRTNADELPFSAELDIEPINLPLVVIVNGGTASAAELVAGAIQDHERGVLVGQQTFGKGTIQHIFPLSDASSIHITSAEWMTPNHHVLDGVGLTPDILVEPDPEGRDVELEAALKYLAEVLQEH